jgi:hypothetical protein
MLRGPHLFSRRCLLAALLVTGLSGWWGAAAQETANDPLPSWNDGAAKKSITDFVARVTTQGGANFVPIDQRIATFDNDGTLWAEQPIYFQVVFALDRLKVVAAQHPEMRTKQPFKAALSKDLPALAASGKRGCWRSSRQRTQACLSNSFTGLCWIGLRPRNTRASTGYTSTSSINPCWS